MKKIFSFFGLIGIVFFAYSVSAFSVPAKPHSYVLDTASMLDQDTKTSLEQNLNQFEKETGNEIAVVTIPSLDGDTIENIAQEIFTKWGIGKKGTNNGVLLLIAKNDHKLRIHVGYGLEPSLTDITASNIINDKIVPSFKADKFAQGIVNGVNAIEAVIKNPDQVVEESFIDSLGLDKYHLFYYGGVTFYLFLMAFFHFLAFLGKTRSWWLGGAVGGVIGILNIFTNIFLVTLLFNILFLFSLILFGTLLDYFASKNYKKTYKHNKKSIPWYFGGGVFSDIGGDGGGGGGGGFGGGGSGGGGASGSW